MFMFQRLLEGPGVRLCVAVFAVGFALAAGLAAAGTATARTAKSCGTVTLNEQAWAGSTATAPPSGS